MRKYIFIVILFLCSCSGEECSYKIIERPPIKYAFIYNENVFQVNADSCQIIGTIGDMSINRRCKVIGPLIEIGTTNVFNEPEYNLNITIYISNSLYFHMIGDFKIFY